MSKFVAYLLQKGGGCDYTIGCGRNLINLESGNMVDAILEMREELRNFSGESELESVKVMHISEEYDCPVGLWYSEIQQEYERQALAIIEERDRIEFERLKRKYG